MRPPSAVETIRAIRGDHAAPQSHNGSVSAAEGKQRVEQLWDLERVGRSIAHVRIVGDGSRASMDVTLDDGGRLLFDPIRDAANPSRLAVELAVSVGATPRLKAPQAVEALALLRGIAEHEAALTTDEIAVDWGVTFLQSASQRTVDIDDQTARWEAFCALERMDPIALARAEGISIATASIVLMQVDGSRLVRCGWFRAFAKTEDPAASPQQIAHRMQRVGWKRRGKDGRIKATQPGWTRQLVWTFYDVAPGWEERQ